jgi:hypothetical protein
MNPNQRSPDISDIAAALAKAQGLYKPLVPNQRHKSESYANLEAIIAATREALSANALAFMYQIDCDDKNGQRALHASLIHCSGQWLSSQERMPECADLKERGTIEEFAARLHALRLLGIAPSASDPFLFDDNAEKHSERLEFDGIKRGEYRSQLERPISNDQYNILMLELDGMERLTKNIQAKHGISSFEDLPESAYHIALGEIKRIKKEEIREKRNR